MRWILFVACCAIGALVYTIMRHRATVARREAMIDHTLEDSFPASDAPCWTPTYGPSH